MRTARFINEPLFPQCELLYYKNDGHLECASHLGQNSPCAKLIAQWPSITKANLSDNLRVAQGTAAKLLLREMDMAKRARSKHKVGKLAQHWHREIRWRAIHNERCPAAALRHIADRPEDMRPYGVLEVVAAHPNCPADLLEQMLESNNRVISQAARRRYRKKHRFIP